MVLKPSKEFLQEALTNNSFDVDSTDKAIRITVDHSFSYLYRLQRNMASYEEYFYTTQNVVGEPDYGDLYLDKRERVCVNFPVSLVLPQQREAFHHSKYYKGLVNYNELTKDHKLFPRLPVLLIDDMIVKDFDMEIHDDFFTAHLPFDRYFIYETYFDNKVKNYRYIEHKMSLQIINSAFFADVKTNTGMLKQNSYNGYSFDRLKVSYLNSLGLDLTVRDKGTFFVTLFTKDSNLGTQLLDVSYDENNDVVIHYDREAIRKLQTNVGEVTVRFIYYRNLYEYIPYGFNGEDFTNTVGVRSRNGKPTSELMMAQKENGDLYQLPIPTENFLCFRTKEGYYDEWKVNERSHFPNKNLDINYPNIYRVTRDVEPGDRLRIFYFYLPPYDLHYDYMYWFYYRYLQYKYNVTNIEEIVNKLYFGTITNKDKGNEFKELISMIQTRSLFKSKLIKEDQIDLSYNYIYKQLKAGVDVEKVKDDLKKILKSGSTGDIAKDPAPKKAEEFAAIFDFIINKEITPYFYDEMDYMKKYSDKIAPLEYKVSKLKSFIKDDYNALHNYVRCQNKVGIKFEFSAHDINLKERYRTTFENGKTLPSPMYVFPVSKPDPDMQLGARIFIDGFLCATFSYMRFEFSDYIYVPVEYVKEDSYFEIEVFPCITDHSVMKFNENNPSCIVEFPSTNSITPTLSDIFFYLGEEKTLDRLPLDSFKLELVSTEYNYYKEALKKIAIYYEAIKGVPKKGKYYDNDGKCYSFEGFRLSDQDITSAEVTKRLTAGTLAADEGYEIDQDLEIVRDKEIVTYDKVAIGESIIVPDKKDVIYSCISRIRVTLLDKTLYNKPITISIAKTPAFEGSKIPSISYPSYIIPVQNSDNIEEYTRAFRNGRLISKNRYDYTDIDGFLGIQILERLNKGETIAFDISPYRNRLVYYRRRITSDCIDLRGYINKPFDNRFYEVYINGRRLNRTNIYPFSPWEIKLGGLHSTYNLEIYEKDRDWEYYGADFEDYLTLSDFIRNAFVEEDIGDRLVHDVTGDVPPNTDEEEPLDWDRELDIVTVFYEIFYYMKLVPMRYVDPMRNDFETAEIKRKYPIIDQLYHQKNDLGEDVLFLDPNHHYEGTETSQGTHKWRTYLLGNADLSAIEIEDEKGGLGNG